MEKFSIAPSKISHNETPVFHASWYSGEIKVPENSLISFYYESSGNQDSILIYQIEWQDEMPNQNQFNDLMDEAITAIDHWITERF